MATGDDAIELRPGAGESERAAVAEAVARLGLEPADVPAGLTSRWRAVALAESVEHSPAASEVAASVQARSPRSTRGATRA